MSLDVVDEASRLSNQPQLNEIRYKHSLLATGTARARATPRDTVTLSTYYARANTGLQQGIAFRAIGTRQV